MNDITRENIKNKLEKAIKDEHITTNEAAGLLKISAPYLSMIKNPENWGKCGITAWETVLKWVNSGQTLEKYGLNHGKTVIEKAETKEPIVKVKPEVLEKRKKELAEKKDPAIQTEKPTILFSYYKEQSDKANAEIKRLMEENTNLIKELNAHEISTLETKESGYISQKVCIDLEINLVINGKKLEIK